MILVEDTTATTSPAGGLENVVYNAGNVSVAEEIPYSWGLIYSLHRIGLIGLSIMIMKSYGFVTNSVRVVEASGTSSNIHITA